MAGNWWDDDPERYDSEISELERAGIRWERDDDAFAAGRLRLRVFPVVDGEELPLVAVFPDEYPWFKFEVEAPTLALPHHQHAFGKVLCLLPRSTEHWRPGSDRLAHFLVERLPLVIATGASEDAAAAAEIEEHQAEPFSDYYTYERNAIVLVDGHWSLPVEARSGRLVLGLEALPPGVKPKGHLRGAIIEIHDDRGGGPIATAEHAHATRFPYRVEGRWARVESPPASNDPSTLYSLMEAADPQRGRLREVDIQHSQRMWIRAVLFPEEHRWRGDALASSAHGWLFAVCIERPAPPAKGGGGRSQFSMGRGRPQAPKKERVCYLARTGRVGRGDLRARAPELAPLAEASIAVFGLGCIGAPSALDLARATVGDLRLIEYDHVDPATMVRWPLGLRAAGVQKLDVMVDLLQRDYPFTSVTGYSLKVGAPQFGPEPSNASMMNDALDGVALVYDATAEYGVQHYLSEVARGKRLPYVGVSSTQGGWGGVVMRIRPGITRGCWACVQLGINDGTIEAPPFDAANGAVQPAGCAEPTYTGANFDLGHVALMGVRLAIATLCSAAGAAASPRSTSAYPDFDWDVGVLALRDTDGRSIAPTWRTYPLPPHPNCQTCAARTRSD